MKLRPYQEEAVAGICSEWERSQSTLIVEPTGCGKTVIFSTLIARHLPAGQRALVLAHRSELVWQAAQKWQAITREEAGVEMGVHRADGNWIRRPRVICSTVQTQIAGMDGEGRMTRFDPSEFGIVIVDEAHRATASTYRRILEYYGQNPKLRVLGVTATPDRSDKQALGQVFESVAHSFELIDAIQQGWLVSPDQHQVHIQGLDFSGIRTKAGDLHGSDLAAVMGNETVIHRTVVPSMEIAGGRRGIFFAASVAQAKATAEVFNRYQPGIAASIDGKMDKGERAKILESHRDGKLQWIVNVGVLTEGYDDDQLGVVVIGRPTKSRSLYAQMVGRGTRPLAGTVDGIADAAGRVQAIADSDKPLVTVVDFVGNSGRHKLVNTGDILGGKYSAAAIDRAKAKVKHHASGGGGGAPFDMAAALDQAEKELADEMKRRQREQLKRLEQIRKDSIKAKVNYKLAKVDAFGEATAQPERKVAKFAELPTPKQVEFLEKHGVDTRGMTRPQAAKAQSRVFASLKNGACTVKQADILKRYGYDTSNLTKAQASQLIDKIAANGWRRPDAKKRKVVAY